MCVRLQGRSLWLTTLTFVCATLALPARRAMIVRDALLATQAAAADESDKKETKGSYVSIHRWVCPFKYRSSQQPLPTSSLAHISSCTRAHTHSPTYAQCPHHECVHALTRSFAVCPHCRIRLARASETFFSSQRSSARLWTVGSSTRRRVRRSSALPLLRASSLPSDTAAAPLRVSRRCPWTQLLSIACHPSMCGSRSSCQCSVKLGCGRCLRCSTPLRV
jgi:hypothetical protein